MTPDKAPPVTTPPESPIPTAAPPPAHPDPLRATTTRVLTETLTLEALATEFRPTIEGAVTDASWEMPRSGWMVITKVPLKDVEKLSYAELQNKGFPAIFWENADGSYGLYPRPANPIRIMVDIRQVVEVSRPAEFNG